MQNKTSSQIHFLCWLGQGLEGGTVEEYVLRFTVQSILSICFSVCINSVFLREMFFMGFLSSPFS